MISNKSSQQNSANVTAKEEQHITLHKTLSFGPGKDLKNTAKLNENSLA